jgi:hypothetical protein
MSTQTAGPTSGFAPHPRTTVPVDLNLLYPGGTIHKQEHRSFPDGRRYMPTFVAMEIGGRPGLIYDELLSPDLPSTTIVSVHPEAMDANLTLVGVKSYHMPAVPKGEWRAHRIYGSGQVILDQSSFPAPGQVLSDDDKPRYAGRPIAHDAVARDVMRQWIGDSLALAGTQHGVAFADGLVPGAELLEQLDELQAVCFRTLVREADNLYQSLDPAKRKMIGAHHHTALGWIGDYDPAGHPWHQEAGSFKSKPCRACRKLIHYEALVCEHCNVALDMFFAERGMMPGENGEADDPTLRLAVERLTQQAQRGQGGRRGK